MTRIGFLGLGSMGSVMARRLVDAGHDVRVWNRSEPATRTLAEAGATAVASPADALAAPISLSMLADDDAALAVLSADAVAASTGRVHVNLASISPAAAGRLSERFAAVGAEYVAAPVLGRPEVAERGELNILAAGPPSAVDEATPVLQILGKRIWSMGPDPAQANATKIAVNYQIIHAIQALGESIALVEARGVAPEAFVELLSETLFGGIVYRGYGTAIATRAYTPPGFAMPLGRKDLHLVGQLADEVGIALPTWHALRDVFDRALEDPSLREVDWAGAAEVTRRGLLDR